MADATVSYPVWDIRAMKKPRAVATDLPAVYPETNVIFSPDEQYVLTGTAGRNSGSSTEENETAKKEARIQDGGKIVVMKKDTLEVVKQFSESPPDTSRGLRVALRADTCELSKASPRAR